MHIRSLFLFFIASAAALFIACGDTKDPQNAVDASNVADSGGGSDATTDAGSDTGAADAGLPPHPDGGPAPVVACADAALPCPAPESVCLDMQWLRSYTNGTCVAGADAGTCHFDVTEVACEPPQYCVSGGCQPLALR